MCIFFAQTKKTCFLCLCQLTTILVLGVEDVAAPLSQVGQHTEHSLNAELREAGRRLLAVSPPFFSSLPFGQHGQHLLCHLAAERQLAWKLYETS